MGVVVGRQARILIADDDAAAVLFLEAVLRQDGFEELVGTTRATDVVPLFLRTKPDLLLLDVHMPECDAFDLMEQLEPHIPRGEVLPVMIVTGDVTPQMRRKALVSGVDDFLLKPVTAAEVVMHVRSQLQRRISYLEGIGESCDLPDPDAPARSTDPSVSCIVDPSSDREVAPVAASSDATSIGSRIAALRSVLQTSEQFEALGRLIEALEGTEQEPPPVEGVAAERVDAEAPMSARLTIVN